MSGTATDPDPGTTADKLSTPGARTRPGRLLARAAGGAAGLTVVAALLGLVRDQAIARLFGASHASDAFLIAWTVPEMAATLLIEDGMALLLVPAFSLALTRRAEGGHVQDPVRTLVADTLPRLSAALACAGGLLVWGAPWAVGVLAPGLDDPRLAVDCTRLTAVTVLTFGITGYFSAALRAHGRFLAPAGVYIAYNIGIIGMTLALHSVWGVRAAAAGVAVGSLLMVLTLLPTFVRLMPGRSGRRTVRGGGSALLGATVLAPVVLFVVCRQSQVFVERFLASSLPDGAISHLNYAQKVAQLPMVLSMMICTVTFPVVARATAAGDREEPGGGSNAISPWPAPWCCWARRRCSAVRPGSSKSSSNAVPSMPRTPPPRRVSCGSTHSVCSATRWSAPCAVRTSRRAGPPGIRSARWAPVSWSPRPPVCS